MSKKTIPENPERIKTSDVEKNFFRAAYLPESIDEEKRTVDVIATTGYRGLRSGFFMDYYEELEMSKKAIRMDRFKKGASVLFGHDSYSLDNLIGVIEKASLDEETGELNARVRFDTDEMGERVFQKVKNGVLRSVSIGYMVYRYEQSEDDEDELPVFRGTDWEPVELSFVSVPFDPNATVRSRNNLQERAKCTIVLREGDLMSKKVAQKTREEDPKAEPVAEPAQEPAPAAEPVLENSPVAEPAQEPAPAAEPESKGEMDVAALMRSCEKAGFTISKANEFVARARKDGLSLADARERLMDEWAKEDRKVVTSMEIEPGSHDKLTVLREGIENAILHRMNPGKTPLDDKGRSYRGLRLLDMGREFLEAHGISTRGMVPSELASKLLSRNTSIQIRTGFQGTTDFPLILANVANKVLLQAYGRYPQTFKPWCSRSTAPDFKVMSRVRFGEGSQFEKVTEHGEYKYGKFSEAGENYAIATYGKIFPFTRQMVINDDLNAFERIVAQMGLNAAQLESDIVYAILTANAAMADGVALFHADHGNLGTAGPISSTTLSEMRKLGRKQTGLDSQKLNVVHSFLLVPVKQETVAQQAVAQILPNQTSTVNVFEGAYRVIPEPRLDDTSENHWYGAADPSTSTVSTIEYSYLEGNESVAVDQEVEFDTDGIKIKGRHDFGAKALDHRGLFKNESAS